MKPNIFLIFLIAGITFLYRHWILAEQRNYLIFHYPLRDNPESTARKEIEEREAIDKKKLQKAFVIAGAVIIWFGIVAPTKAFNFETESAKSQKAVYISEYQSGWEDQCAALFSRLAGSNNLAYGRGFSISYPQCLSIQPDGAAENSYLKHIGDGYIRDVSEYEMGQKGRAQADNDVLDKLFSISPYWCYGNSCVTSRDFRPFG